MNKTQYSLFFIGYLTLLLIILNLSTLNIKTNAAHYLQERTSNMNIRIDVEGSKQPIFVTLIDSQASYDLIKQLPLSLKLKDYAASEKIANLPQKLSTQGAPKGYAGQPGTRLGVISHFSTKILMLDMPMD